MKRDNQQPAATKKHRRESRASNEDATEDRLSKRKEQDRLKRQRSKVNV